jgi:hypothetical protein
MTTNELKWYVVSQTGSRVDKGKILRNEKLYKLLKTVFKTSEINNLLGHLYNIGFTLVTDSGIEHQRDIVNPNYIEELKFDTLEGKNYAGQRRANDKKIYKDCYNERRREAIKYGITKVS